MPKLKEIITYINSSLQTSLANEKFQGGEWYNGIAELVPSIDSDVRTTYPAIIDNYGEGTSVVIDDTLPIQVYHRLISTEYQTTTADLFGDAGNNIQETAEMFMIVISDRNKIQMHGTDLIAYMLINIPQYIPSSVLSTLNLYDVNINIESVNTNMEEVFKQEYNLDEYGLKTNSIFYSVKYKIITSFNKLCFPICV